MKIAVEGQMGKVIDDEVARHQEAEVKSVGQPETSTTVGSSPRSAPSPGASRQLEEIPGRPTQKLQSYLQKRRGNSAFWSARAVQYGKSLTATASTSWVRAASLRRLKKIVRANDSVFGNRLR